MNTELTTIDTHELHVVTGGGGKADLVRRGATWAWNNVVKPVASGAAWEAASRWLGGGSQQQPAPQQPQQQQPQQGQ